MGLIAMKLLRSPLVWALIAAAVLGALYLSEKASHANTREAWAVEQRDRQQVIAEALERGRRGALAAEAKRRADLTIEIDRLAAMIEETEANETDCAAVLPACGIAGLARLFPEPG